MKIQKMIPTLITVAVLAVGLTACMSEREEENGSGKLKAEAKVSESEARQIAMNKVPNGTIKEAGIEKEKGRLIWSFDIATPGTKNITEVAVDAINGQVVSVDTETPESEAKEKAADKKEKD